MTYQRRQPPNLLKQQLKLSSLIIPEYYAAHTAIWSGEYNEYLGDGGRGSLKSTFAATEVVLLVMRVPNIHAVVLRKVGNTIATSVWPEYNRVIDRMGIRHLWKQTKKPYTLTYVPTGQTIQFYGLDDPGKLKSIAVPFGYTIDKKTGDVMPGYVDAANHSIDMTRYAMEPIWQKRGVQNA